MSSMQGSAGGTPEGGSNQPSGDSGQRAEGGGININMNMSGAAGYGGMVVPGGGVGVKSRVVAGVLAILLGGIGAHKFYLGKTGLGVLYLIFVWTFVPGIIGFIEGVIYLVQSDQQFSMKQGVAVRAG